MGEQVLRKSQRGAMRRAVKLPCEVLRGKDHALVGRQGLDVSQDGLLLLSEADVTPGDLVMVSFKATDFGLLFRTSATVARVIEGRRTGDRGRSIALSFRSLDAVSRLILRGHFRRVPPPIPRRPQPVDYAASLARSLSRA